MDNLIHNKDTDLFVNIITSLKNISDLKWTLRALNSEQLIKSQNLHLSSIQKKEILEESIKLTIKKVLPNIANLEHATIKAIEILNDLQSTKRNTTIRIMGYILIKFLKSKLQGLYINEHSLLLMKSNFNKSPVIFVPSHRSYLDFILMAFVCFNYNIDIPYVAAAMDFKNMKVMGNVLKQCGAFFLHRGKHFQDNIYKLVLYSYVKHLITYENSPLQFFIEGTRSRTNKSMSPKLGILKCILNVLLNHEVEDITIIPISINYDRLLEDKLFSYEHLGIPKPKETTLGLINSIKKMDDCYGNIYINFATPFSLRKYIEDIHINENNNESHKISTLAHEIIYRQQQSMILSYSNILAVALIYNILKNMTSDIHLNIIIDQINWISKLFKKCGSQIETKDCDLQSRIIDIIRLHQHYVILKDNKIQFQKHYTVQNNIIPFNSSGNLNFKAKTIDHAFPLILNQLYVNPLLHFIINIAFMIIVSNCQIIWKNGILDLKEKFFLLRRLFEFEFILFAGCDEQDFKKSLSIFIHLNEKEKELIRFLIIYPYISCYRIIYSSLINICQKIITEEYIFKHVHMKIEETQAHPYGLSKSVIKAALDALYKIKIIEKYKENETMLYDINKTMLMELVQIFDNFMLKENNVLKSKM